VLTRPCIREFVHIQSGCQASKQFFGSFITEKRTSVGIRAACMADARLGSRSGQQAGHCHRDPVQYSNALFSILQRKENVNAVRSYVIRSVEFFVFSPFCDINLRLVTEPSSNSVLCRECEPSDLQNSNAEALASYFRKGSSTHVF
jgi:hypothetical protein